MYFYTCEHDKELCEGSLLGGDNFEESAVVYAEICGNVSNYHHTVYVWDKESFEKIYEVVLKYEMGIYKIIEVTTIDDSISEFLLSSQLIDL